MQATGRAGQPGVSAWRRLNAAVMSGAHGQTADSRSLRRRLPRTSRPAAENSRRRSRRGSQRRAGPVRASIAVQASRSLARATISHQIWFWAKPCSGRLRRPVSFAQRIRFPGPRREQGARRALAAEEAAALRIATAGLHPELPLRPADPQTGPVPRRSTPPAGDLPALHRRTTRHPRGRHRAEPARSTQQVRQALVRAHHLPDHRQPRLRRRHCLWRDIRARRVLGGSHNAGVSGAGGIRTHTGRNLNPVPLPLGYGPWCHRADRAGGAFRSVRLRVPYAAWRHDRWP